MGKITDSLGKAIAGARPPTWVRQCPKWVPVVLFAASSLAAIPTNFTEGWALAGWVAGASFLFWVAAGLLWARSENDRVLDHRKDVWIKRAETEHRQALRKLLYDDLFYLLYVVAEVLVEPDPANRRLVARSARKTVICATAKLVGKPIDGTRANLFIKNGPRMTLESGMFYGRGDQSQRVFEPGNDIYDKTMANQWKFVRSIDAAIIEQEGLPYKTYLTHPVSIGPGHIYGVLTVDCLNEGDLDPLVDQPMVAVLSTLIALTFQCEAGQPTVNQSA